VLARGLALTTTGTAAGIVLAMLTTRMLGSLLFGVGTFDAVTFGAAAMIVIGAGAGACGIPASRAARVDPLSAIRDSA
jgi:ABC-type antimicrobial peptide transport system permease subunit